MEKQVEETPAKAGVSREIDGNVHLAKTERKTCCGGQPRKKQGFEKTWC